MFNKTLFKIKKTGVLSARRSALSFGMKKIFLGQALLISTVLSAQTQMDTSGVSLQTKRQTITADSLPAQTIGEFVVTGSRTEKTLLESGRSISVLRSEDIRRSGANTLAELLNMAEGVFISGSQQNFGSNQSLFLRGSNANQSIIMIDGITVSDPSTPNNALDLSELTLSDIDRIEILRGSHSTLYGSSAIGGVIHIITRKSDKPGFTLQASGTAGAFDEKGMLVSEDASFRYQTKSGAYAAFNMGHSYSDGMDATIDTSSNALVPRDHDANEQFQYSVKAGIKTKRWDIHLTRQNAEKSSEIDDREFDDDDNYLLDFNRKSLRYGIQYKADSSFSIRMAGGRSEMLRTSLDDSSLIDQNNNYDQQFYRGDYSATAATNELQLDIHKKYYSFVIGGGVAEQTMNQKIYAYSPFWTFESDLDSLNLESRTHSFFALAEIKGGAFSEKVRNLIINLGARSNKNNTFGSSFTYHLNPLVKLNQHTTLYFNMSSGYNAPSLYQLHSPDRDFNSQISRGNINLLPEQSITRELGFYQKLNKKNSLRFGYFQTDVKDIIEYVYLWNKNTPVSGLSFLDYMGDTYMNLGSFRTEGFEMDINGEITKRLSYSGNFSLVRGKYLYSFESIDTVKSAGNHVQLYSNGAFVSQKDVHSKGLTRRPVTANLSLTYEISDKWFVRTTLRFVSEKKDIIYDPNLGPYGALGAVPVNSYLLADLVSGWKFSGNFSFLVRIENIADQEYSEIRGYSGRGRGIYFTAQYAF